MIFSHASVLSDLYGASARFEMRMPSQGVEDREFNVVFAKKLEQRLFALDLRKAAEIAITPEEIEGVVDEPALPARGEFGLKFGKVGASLMDDHHLAVDDGFA